jgi:DinB superfamily
MPTTTTDTQELFVKTVLFSWEQALGQASAFFSNLTDEEFLQPIAPAKNRIIYLLGHLAAVHDRMLPLLGIGDRQYPHLDETFVTSPDNPATPMPSPNELRHAWTTVNNELTQHLRDWTPEEWLQRHTAVSAEDFAKEPHRNRLSVVLSRTRHVGYHMGQLILYKK